MELGKVKEYDKANRNINKNMKHSNSRTVKNDCSRLL